MSVIVPLNPEQRIHCPVCGRFFPNSDLHMMSLNYIIPTHILQGEKIDHQNLVWCKGSGKEIPAETL